MRDPAVALVRFVIRHARHVGPLRLVRRMRLLRPLGLALLVSCVSLPIVPAPAAGQPAPPIPRLRVLPFSAAPGVDANPVCPLSGPMALLPGQPLPHALSDALRARLIARGMHDETAYTVLEGRLDRLEFSLANPARWSISLRVFSNRPTGYSVSVDHDFDTAGAAYSVCVRVQDAIRAALDAIVTKVLDDPGFAGNTR